MEREEGLRGSQGDTQQRLAGLCTSSGYVKGTRALCDLGGECGHLGCCQLGSSASGWDLVTQPPQSGSHLSSPASSCPEAFPRCGGHSATVACARKVPGPSSSACARAWASTAGLTQSPVSAPGCSHQTTAALGTGQKGSVTPGPAQRPTLRRVRGVGQGGGPRTLSAQETGEGRHWTGTQKTALSPFPGSTPANCQQTPYPVVSCSPPRYGYPSRFSLNFKHV